MITFLGLGDKVFREAYMYVVVYPRLIIRLWFFMSHKAQGEGSFRSVSIYQLSSVLCRIVIYYRWYSTIVSVNIIFNIWSKQNTWDTNVEEHYQHQSLEMQKALLLTEIGKPLSLGTRPIPTPGPGQVLVKLTATQSS
jgi:hypothetical protein